MKKKEKEEDDEVYSGLHIYSVKSVLIFRSSASG